MPSVRVSRVCGRAVSAGMTALESPIGDFNGDDVVDVADIDALVSKVGVSAGAQPVSRCYDLDENNVITLNDHRILVKDVAYTYYGDANLDGEFNTGDLTRVLEAGKYETQEYASWAEGDWNGDGVFDTGDIVKALDDGGYEMGPRESVAVPEPSAWVLCVVASSLYLWRRRR